MNFRKVWVVALALLGVALFFWLDLGHMLSFAALKQRHSELVTLYQNAPLTTLALFFALYVAVTAMSLPVATVLTLAAGAVFGLAVGTVVVSFAAAGGATLAMLASRYLLRDTVQRRFGDRFAEINRNVETNGAFYLFSLRLLPVVPFFVINLALGLTSMNTWTFYWVSQVGMLAATAAYVNAGTALAQINAVSDILSLRLVGALVLLACLPWVFKQGLHWREQRRIYQRWLPQKPRRFDQNLVVIGAGAAGLVTAYIAAAVKARVTLIEGHKMGGDCLNYGCVPSKALLRSAKAAHQMRHGSRYGLQDVQPAPNFKAVMQRVHDVVAAIAPHDSVQRYTELGVNVVQGQARILTPWSVEVTVADGSRQVITTRSIVIATGARPFVPPLPGLDDVGYLTSDTLWDALAKLDAIPQRIVVLGGGPIGCELAQALARLGAQVTQVEMAPRIMVREDAEVSALVLRSLQADGIQVLTGHKALRCELAGTGKRLIALHNEQEVVLEFDTLVCAVGRVARLQGYGLEELAIPVQRTVPTNAYLQTLYPNIFAAGDVVGPYQFTHVAAHQAWYAAVNALFGSVKRFKVDYSVIPWTTFVDPEVAHVGLSEQDAIEQKRPYEVTRYELDDLDRAIADGETTGFVKVLTPPGQDKILGVTIVGAHAGELLAEYVLAMKHGLGLNKLLGTIHAYPTMAEANKYAAGVWKKAHQPATLLRWAEKYHGWKRG